MHLYLYNYITKMASRNVAFKAARMSESVLESQDEVIVRKPEVDEEGNDGYDKAALDTYIRY